MSYENIFFDLLTIKVRVPFGTPSPSNSVLIPSTKGVPNGTLSAITSCTYLVVTYTCTVYVVKYK